MEEKARGIDAGFMNGEFDVLLATIIESGWMFNANTIFINNIIWVV
jgi:transcription-repair coupling factor (superfamily II helicase)